MTKKYMNVRVSRERADKYRQLHGSFQSAMDQAMDLLDRRDAEFEKLKERINAKVIKGEK